MTFCPYRLAQLLVQWPVDDIVKTSCQSLFYIIVGVPYLITIIDENVILLTLPCDAVEDGIVEIFSQIDPNQSKNMTYTQFAPIKGQCCENCGQLPLLNEAFILSVWSVKEQ